MEIRVVIEFFATLRDKFGKRMEVVIDCNPATIKNVFSKVEGLDEVSENKRIKRMYKILITSLNIEFIGGLNAKVKGGDEI